jgi:hypothetical protein
MPLLRYFVFVGGALLALLFIVDACLPALPVATSSRSTVDLSVIRIHSDNKLPERVVFDTTRPTITPAPAAAMAEVVSPQRDVAQAPQERVREAFAQVTPNPGRLEPKRKRKSVAKNYTGPPRLLVAQQRPVVFFGNNIW